MSRRAGAAVLAVCVEVASPDLMEDWLARGWMPNLARVRREGAWAEVESVADVSSGAVWPSFTTGLLPARHGQFFTHMQLATGSYEIVKKYADDVPGRPFWAALGEAGLSTAVIDVPQTRPQPGFRGAHVVGWGGEYPAWPRSSEPPGLMDEILERFGPHPLAETRRIAARPEGEAEYARLRADLLRGVRAKAAISRLVLGRGPHSLFLTVFAEPHWAMHLLWDTIDPGHPRHEPDRAARYAGTFREILAEIDAFIGEARALRPEADLVVFSLSGMGPNHSGCHLLPEALARLGMAGSVGGGAASRPPPLRRLEAAVPAGLLDRAKEAVPARLWDRWTRRLLYRGAGWAGSRAFCLPNDASGAVRVNLAGREPAGKVAAGAEYEAVCAEIERALRELVDVATGRPAVREVVRTREAFGGERLDDLPDLLVLWPGDLPLQAVHSPRLGEIRLPSPERRTGGHRSTGFLAAAGPGIAAGARAPAPVRVVDLGATFLRLLDLPPPDGDGRVPAWLLR